MLHKKLNWQNNHSLTIKKTSANNNDDDNINKAVVAINKLYQANNFLRFGRKFKRFSKI